MSKDGKFFNIQSSFNPIVEKVADEMQVHFVNLYEQMGGSSQERFD